MERSGPRAGWPGAVAEPSSQPQTVRYYATSQQVYARAVMALVTYARTHQEDFTIGALDLAAMEHQGLTVTGPDLSGVQETLSKVPGLVSQDEQEEQ